MCDNQFMAAQEKNQVMSDQIRNNQDKALVHIQGKQHVVSVGLRIECDKLDQEIGSELSFDKVLCLIKGGKTEFGKPYLKNTVKAKVIDQYRDKKVIIFKKLRRHGYQRKKGHRQHVTVLEIMSIE